MNRTVNIRTRQHGAVAIVVGLSLFVLVALLGLVLDLGHVYIVRTQLQNAADAAALSGAKQLDGTLAGVGSAVNYAIAAAGYNRSDFTVPVSIDIGDISVGNCPQDSCMTPASSISTPAQAAGLTFLKVMIPSGSMNTWFMRAIPGGQQSTATYGLAVAGKYVVNITPLAVCRLPDPGTTNELGYERGVTYRISDANPIGPGTMYWIDPASAIPGQCSVTNTPDTLPFICTGKTGFTPMVGQTVNTNTGVSTPQVMALNSRLGMYTAQNKCDPASAPPDTNVRQYVYNGTGAGAPGKWMNPTPVQQSLTFGTYGGVYREMPYASRTFASYGVLWSAYRPSGATVAQWSTLYNGNAVNYPESSPYAQRSGNYFLAPPVAYTPVPGRRIMNMVIVDCTTAGGVCRPASVLGIGRFFLQMQASGPKDVYVEFGGLLPTPLPTSDIKLYR